MHQYLDACWLKRIVVFPIKIFTGNLFPLVLPVNAIFPFMASRLSKDMLQMFSRLLMSSIRVSNSEDTLKIVLNSSTRGRQASKRSPFLGKVAVFSLKAKFVCNCK
jgi:hypothetical protein